MGKLPGLAQRPDRANIWNPESIPGSGLALDRNRDCGRFGLSIAVALVLSLLTAVFPPAVVLGGLLLLPKSQSCLPPNPSGMGLAVQPHSGNIVKSLREPNVPSSDHVCDHLRRWIDETNWKENCISRGSRI